MEKVIKSFVAKQIDTTNHIVEAYASTKDIDRDGEIILPTAWDLEGYNGIIINSHDYGNIENALGKVVEAKTDDKGLFVKIQYFVGQGNETADWAWVLAQNGLASYSVGFIPIESISGSDDVKRIYTKVKLLEISQVLVPANPYAVQDSVEYQPLIKEFKEIKEVAKMDAQDVKNTQDDKEITNTEEEVNPKNEEVKYGRVLSEANRTKVKNVLDGITRLQKELEGLQDPLKELLDLSEVETNSASLEAVSQKSDRILDILEELKKSL